jgi:hypothetical protein
MSDSHKLIHIHVLVCPCYFINVYTYCMSHLVVKTDHTDHVTCLFIQLTLIRVETDHFVLVEVSASVGSEHLSTLNGTMNCSDDTLQPESKTHGDHLAAIADGRFDPSVVLWRNSSQ